MTELGSYFDYWWISFDLSTGLVRHEELENSSWDSGWLDNPGPKNTQLWKSVAFSLSPALFQLS
jgi:hypothetical protein